MGWAVLVEVVAPTGIQTPGLAAWASSQAPNRWHGRRAGDRRDPHVLSDANGLPLLVCVAAANTHDSLALKPMIMGRQTRHDPHRGRHFKLQRLHADKAYDVPHLRKWLRGERRLVRIAHKGIESSERLGRRRWVIERTVSWLTGYRRLNHRYERHPRNYLAFLGRAAAICCYKRLVRLTT